MKKLPDRDQRVTYALGCLMNDKAKTAFLYLTKEYPKASIFWDEDENKVEIMEAGLSIEIYSFNE